MIFNSGTIYGKVWKVTKPEGKKYIELQMSTYEKGQDDQFVYSSWFPRAIGHAFNSLKDLPTGELKTPISITITKSKFTNERYEAQDGTKKSAFRFLILEASLDGEKKSENNNTTTESTPTPTENPPADDSCPW